MNAPAIVIRLELECAPVVYLDCAHDGEHDRLLDWLTAHPEEREIVDRANAIVDRKRAA